MSSSLLSSCLALAASNSTVVFTFLHSIMVQLDAQSPMGRTQSCPNTSLYGVNPVETLVVILSAYTIKGRFFNYFGPSLAKPSMIC